jgi:hypothetical protein
MRQIMQQLHSILQNDEVEEAERNNAQPIKTENIVPTRNIAQNVPDPTKPTRSLVVIPAPKKRQKAAPVADAPVKRLDPRLRQIILLVTTLIVIIGSLITLVPLSSGQNGFTLFSGLRNFLSSSQSDLQIQAQETQTAVVSHEPPLTLSHSQYVAIAEQDATNVGISPTYFVRQIQLESGFNPYALSPSGAQGIAQFMPGTAAGLGIDPWNPIQALQAAAQMMANLYHQYGDYAKALAAYNAGSANLNRAVQSCGANWLSCMPAETQHYVAVIMG